MTGRYKNLLRNTALLAVGTFGSKLLVFFLLPLYTRYLTPEMYSAAELISQMSNLLIPLACLGLSDGIFRFAMDRERDKRVTFSTGFLLLLAATAVFVLLSPLLSVLSYFEGYIGLIVGYVLAANFHAVCAQYLRAQGKTGIFAFQGLLNTFLNIVFNIVFLIPLRMGVLGFVLSVVVADILTTFFLVVYARLWRDIRISFFSRKTAVQMLVYSIPMIPTTVFWWVTSVSDRYLVQHFCGDGVNGLYSAAYKIPTLLTLLCTVFIEAWQLSAVKDSEKEERTAFFSQVYAGFSGLMFLACSFLMALCEVGTDILFDVKYAQAWVYIPVLLIATVFSALVTYLGSVYFVKKKSVLSFLTAMLGAVVNLALNFALIPTYGAQGAAIATLASYVIVYVVRAMNTHRHLPFAQHPLRILANTVVVALQAVCMIMRPACWIPAQVGAVILVFLMNLKPLSGVLFGLWRALAGRLKNRSA